MLKILRICRFFRPEKEFKKRVLIIRGSLVRAQLGPRSLSKFNPLKGFFSINSLITKWRNFTISFVNPSGLEPPPQSSPRLKCSTGAFFNSGSRFKPSWAHTVNEPLTTNFCRWFFLCCQFGASFRQDFRLKFGRN